MDPISAIGLVSGILTFVGAAEKILKLSWTLYNAIEGSSEETAIRLKLAESLTGITARMTPLNSVAPATSADRGLDTLAQECNRLTNEMKKELNNLKPKHRKSKTHSVIAALKTVLVEPKIKDMERHLQSCRDQLHFHISAMSSEIIKQLLATCKQDGSKLTQLDLTVSQLKQTLQDMTTQYNHISDQALSQLKAMLHVGQDTLNQVAQDRILRGIKAGFVDMTYRHQTIERPFGQTLEWKLELGGNSPAAAKFSQWLASGEGIFHICGRLGSGKSTLMKKLCIDKRTRETLGKWARGRQLVIASFFFYALGSDPRQKSLMGLCRTLLYQILAASPDLIQTVFPEQWTRTLSQPRVQSECEILDDDVRLAYDLLAKQKDDHSLGERCFALFIDGLDEYQETPAVDRRKLVSFLADLVAHNSGQFKVCVSSRMENPFMDMFSEDTRLYLHKLTRTDMEEYVKEHLRCVGTERERDQLATSITTKAEGVFLWVVLVVQRIRKESDDGARFSLLLREVETLPNQLSELFQRILDGIPEGAKRRLMSRTISLLNFLTDFPNVKRMYLWLGLDDYYFLEDYDTDQWFAERISFPGTVPETANDRRSLARRRLRGVCGGLVEANEANDLGFIHRRSIRDFIAQEHVQSKLRHGFFKEMDALSQLKLANIRQYWWDAEQQNLVGVYDEQLAEGFAKSLNHHAVLIACLVEQRRKQQLDTPPFSFLECLDTIPQLSVSRMVRYALACRKTSFHITLARKPHNQDLLSYKYKLCHISQVRHRYDGTGLSLLYTSEEDKPGTDPTKRNTADAGAVAMPSRAADEYIGRTKERLEQREISIALSSPLFTELCSGRLEYPLWKVDHIRDGSLEADKLAMLTYFAIWSSLGTCLWWNRGDHDAELETAATAAVFLRHLFERQIVSPNLVTQIAFGGENDLIRIASGDQRVSIWQHFICWWATVAAASGEFRPNGNHGGAGRGPSNESSEQQEVGKVLETFIRNGADLHLILKITARGTVFAGRDEMWMLRYTLEMTPGDGTTAPLELDVVLNLVRGTGPGKYPYGAPYQEFQRYKSPMGSRMDEFRPSEVEQEFWRLPDSPLSLRDWIGLSRLPNKRSLLQWMDRQEHDMRQSEGEHA